ncbi:NAD(P)/FAD-dependent oxidoreductase [Vreelandella salicampi]|uniref:Protein CbrA n=1 Tax=Vreelandella salicampi TaxID=1449798 RepID=A0A7Z0LM52_9GAMM|nr:FAD-dependent monooxygenase [Halomonas salicampi]NYS61457.1 FAD-dependent monooxygenase [Halomonas salicampi]
MQTTASTKIPPTTAEVVVVGGGPAGAGAACMLAKAGREVMLLEREATATHKICGEFLSAETQSYLRRLGLDLDALGGHVISHLRLIREKTIVETALPFHALGLSRFRLDEALLNHASESGASLWRGQRASVSNVSGSHIDLDVKSAGKVSTNTLFLATGKHDLRELRRHPVTPPEDLVGFKMHFDVDSAQCDALANHVELVLFAHGYAGLQRVEDGRVNLCLLAKGSWLKACGGTWEGLLEELLRTCPHLQRRLSNATPLLSQPLSIYRVPYGFVYHPPANDADNIYRLGDQVGVIPSFSGDGMGIALHSGVVAASDYLAGLDAGHYHRHIRRDIARQIWRAGLLYRASRWSPSRRLLMSLAGLTPRSLSLATSLTRIPPAAVTRAMRRIS